MNNMKLTAAVLVAVASLALFSPSVECGGLSCLMLKHLSKEWQWIDAFLKDEQTRERIDDYFESSQATMEPKMRAAFKLVKDAVNVFPPRTGCSESESQKITALFDALNMDINAKTDQKSSGIRKFAFDRRIIYGKFCAKEYAGQLNVKVKENLDPQVRSMVEAFGVNYADARAITKRDLLDPAADVVLGGLVTSGLMGRALFDGLNGVMSRYEKQIHKVTGTADYNWLEIVEDVKSGCKAYQGQVKDVLELVSKDEVVSRALAQLGFGLQIWRSWTATIACDRLERFDVDKLAQKLALVAARSATTSA